MDAAKLAELQKHMQGEKRKVEAAGALHAPAPLTELSTNASALNASNPEALGAVLGGEGGAAVALRSDADEQLLLSIDLPQTYKLHSLSLAGPADGTAPSTVKLFVNRSNMSFADTEDFCPTQVLNLSSASGTIPLQQTKFTAVSSLTVFIEGNQGDAESTCLSHLGLVGVPVHTTNMKELKKSG